MWHEDTGYLSLAVNDGGERDDAVASNPGHLLFTGILSPTQADQVVSRLMQDDISTAYGLRTLSTNDKAFDPESYQQGSVWPYDNWVIYQGLLKTGHTAEATKIGHGLVTACQELGMTPELYTVSTTGELSRHKGACRVQAWSAGALIDILSSRHRPII